MKIKKILIGVGESQYDVLNIFADKIAQGFRVCGAEVDIVDLNIIENSQAYIKSNKYDMLFSFNGLFAIPGMQLVTNRKNILVWSFMVDHPYSKDGFLLENIRYHVVSCVDRKHVKYMDDYYYNNQWRCFIPHGGSIVESDCIFDKENDVTILGSIQPEIIAEYENKMSGLNEIMAGIVINSVNSLIYEGQTLDEALKNQFSTYGIELAEEEFRILVNELNYVDMYARVRKRIEVVSALIQNGIKVHIYGSGWSKLTGLESDNLIIHNAIGYNQALEIISKSRIVVNTMPLFTDGSHERVFDTMGHKAICFTDRSIYLEENFEDEKDLFFYSMNNLQDLADKVKSVLSGEYDIEAIIQRAYDKICQFHTWDKRAEEILDYAEKIDIPDEKFIITNPIDYGFQEICNYFENVSEAVLTDKIKASFYQLNKLQPDYTDKLYRSFNTYKFWGTWNPQQNDFGVIQDRITQIKKHIDDFKSLYSWLCDYESKNILLQLLINWENMNAIFFQNIAERNYSHYFDLDIVDVSKEEVFIDLGSYVGDTVSSYINTFGTTYKRIYCYEFNPENVQRLRSVVQGFDNIEIKECAVGGTCGFVNIQTKQDDNSAASILIDDNGAIPMVTLDEDINEKITFIKSDIEGAEIEMLHGAREHIRQDHPKLAISVYHGNSDIWEIPKLIHEIDSSYKFYLRYYGGNLYPNEIVLYGV